MIKSPITKNGHIRYFELFKIVILMTFFSVNFSFAFKSIEYIAFYAGFMGIMIQVIIITLGIYQMFNIVKEICEFIENYVFT